MAGFRTDTVTVSITLELTNMVDPLYRQRQYELRAYLCGAGAPARVAAVKMGPDWFHQAPDAYVRDVVEVAIEPYLKELIEMVKDTLTEVRLAGHWPV